MSGIEDAFAAATGSKIVDDSQEQTQQQETQPETQVEQQVEQQTEERAEQQTEQPTRQEETSSLNNESESVDEPTDTELLEYFNEKFDTNYSSVDDFSDALKNKPQFASEELQRLNDFVSNTGRGVNDFYKAYNNDYDKMSDEQIMMENLQMNNPNLSKQELDLYYRSTYKSDKDKYKEDEVALGKINLKKDAAKAREELKQVQESIQKPSENYLSPDEMKNIREDWLDNLDKEVDELEGIAFELDDKGNEFTFSLTEEDKDNLYNNNSNLDGFFNRYMDEGSGKWNMEKLNMEMFILNNFDRIVRSVASQNKGAGREEIIKDIKNPSFTPQQKTTERTSKTLLDQIEDELSGDRTPRTI